MKYFNCFFKDRLFTNINHAGIKSVTRFFLLLLIISLCTGIKSINAGNLSSYISVVNGEGYFAISESGSVAPIYVDKNEFQGVKRVLAYFQNDVHAVCGSKPELLEAFEGKEMIIVGTIGKSDAISSLVKTGKIDISGIEGKWESFLIEVVEKPLPGVEKALVIAGSDKRGTIYGIFNVSENIGVSPWYWWGCASGKKRITVCNTRKIF